MHLHFVKMSPSGNTTILVTDPVPLEDHLRLAHVLMSAEYLAAEQVGFVEEPQDFRAAARLRMMGGEFCANATRALAAFLADNNASPDGTSLQLESSGSETLVHALVRPKGENTWWTELAVPVPTSLQEESVCIDGRDVPLLRVTMPGIEHLILEDVSPSVTVYDQVLRSGVFTPAAEARGIMFHDTDGNMMTPLVAVGDNAPVWEGSCGSGSVALAASIAHRKGVSLHDLLLRQPDGELSVDVEWNGAAVTAARIKGRVERIAAGTVYVPNRLLHAGEG